MTFLAGKAGILRCAVLLLAGQFENICSQAEASDMGCRIVSQLGMWPSSPCSP